MSGAMAAAKTPPWCQPLPLGAALVCVWLVLSLWMADGGMPPDDEGALLTNAARLLHGDVYYRDIDAYPLPGASYLLAAAMAGFGPRVGVGRALAIVASAALVVSLYLLAVQVLGARRAAAFGLCLLCFKFLAWPAYTAYMYGDIALALGSLGILLVLGGEPGNPRGASRPGWARWFAAGLCVAAAITAKQNLGLYLALALGAVALSRTAGRNARMREAGLPFALGVGGPLALGMAYFAAQGVLGTMLHSALIRPFTDYWPTSGVSFLEPLRFWELGSLGDDARIRYFSGPFLLVMGRWGARLGELAPWLMGLAEVFSRLVYASIPATFGLAAWRAFRAWRGGRWDEGCERSAGLALAAAAVMASAFPRADFYHVIGVYPLVVLVGFDLWMGFQQQRRPWLTGFALGAISALLLGSATVAWLHQRAFDAHLALPRANLRVSPASLWVESVVRFVDAEVRPGEPLFVYGHEATFYFLSDRYSPWPFAQLYPGQQGARQGGALAQMLERDPPRLVIRGQVGDPPLPSYTRNLALWLRNHYAPSNEVFQQFPPPGGIGPPPWQAQVFARSSPDPPGGG